MTSLLGSADAAEVHGDTERPAPAWARTGRVADLLAVITALGPSH